MATTATTTPQAPVVKNLSDIIAELNPSIQGQRDLIQQQIKDNETSGTAQIAGLDQAKNNAFRRIVGESQDRGALFSGFSPEQEARYTGETYLPALAKLQQQIAATRGQLQMQNAQLDTNVFNQAFNRQGQQESEANAWNQMLSGQQFESGENQKTRDFQTTEREATQTFQARQQELANQFSHQENEIQRAFDAGENEKARQLQVKLQQDKIAADRELQILSDKAAAARQASQNAATLQAAARSAAAAEAKDKASSYNSLVSQASKFISTALGREGGNFTKDTYIDKNELGNALQQVRTLVGDSADSNAVLVDALRNLGYQPYGKY